MTQFSLFGAAAAEPEPADLDGLLLAGGGWVRGNGGARVSVVVADRWRADALRAEFEALGLGADDAVVAASSGFGVRTAFDQRLLPHAARWTRGANQGLPRDFRLGAVGLRLWAIAVGRRDEAGYVLATADDENPVHQAAGGELSRLGVAAVSLGRRGGPGWRVTSARRLRRLAELLGPAPDGAGDGWPPGS